MDFLIKTSPSVNWKSKTVTCYVGTQIYNLPTCSIGDVDNVTDANSFAGLDVDVNISNSENELLRDVTISKNSNNVALQQDA